jgi:hypothetical protein
MKNLIVFAIAIFTFGSLNAQTRYQLSNTDQAGVLLDTLVAADTAIYILPRTITEIGQLSFQYSIQDTITGGAVSATYSVQARLHKNAGWTQIANGSLATAPIVDDKGSSQGSTIVTVTNTPHYEYRFVVRNAGAGKNHSSLAFAYWQPTQIALSND